MSFIKGVLSSLRFFPHQPSVRKTHNTGRKHKDSVKAYYMSWLEREAQNMMTRSKNITLCSSQNFNNSVCFLQIHSYRGRGEAFYPRQA